MPIELFDQQELGFHVVRMTGALDNGQLRRLHRFHAENVQWLKSDVIHILTRDLDCSPVELGEIDALRSDYSTLFRSLDLYLVRRAGWLCLSASAMAYVDRWLRGRHAHDGLGADIMLAVELARLAPVFEEEELEAVRAWRGFSLIGSIDGDAAAPRRGEVDEADFVAFITTLADTGQYRDADEVRQAMSNVADDLVRRYWAEDLHQCVNIRCIRAAS